MSVRCLHESTVKEKDGFLTTGVKFATVSQHLTVLKNAGIITDDKRGKQVFYRLTCPCIAKTIECISKKTAE